MITSLFECKKHKRKFFMLRKARNKGVQFEDTFFKEANPKRMLRIQKRNNTPGLHNPPLSLIKINY